MRHGFILAMVVLAVAPLMEAGWLAAGGSYWSCMGACCSGAAAGGLMASVMTFGVGGAFGAAACAAVCSSLAAGTAVFIPGLCFADGTIVVRRVGNSTERVNVEQLLAGEEVLGALGGRPTWTQVLGNQRVLGPAAFVHLTIKAGNDEYQAAVTEQHLMLRIGQYGSVPAAEKSDLSQFSPLGWTVKLAPAGNLSLGEVLPVQRGQQFERGELVQVRRETKLARNILSTADGSVVADGVLTTTGCDGRTATAVSGPLVSPSTLLVL